MLARCLAGDPPPALPPALLEEPCAPALFSILVEGLADRFEPALCDAYARLFASAVAQTAGDFDAAALLARYRRVRRARAVSVEPRRVFVLSRVTLGADVAVTSVLLDAAKRRFPHARIVFVGPQKNYELFAGDARLEHAPVAYQRGNLRSRLAVWSELRALCDVADALVLDPDSRLTQLGLLPICPDERYHLFESRTYGGDGNQSLPELAAAWARETLQVEGARPYLALAAPAQARAGITVSLGVGENPAKRLPDPFEEKLLALLAATGLPLTIDKGAGGEEAARVEEACRRAGIAGDFLGRLVRRLRRAHRRQPPVCRLRFRRPACRRSGRRPADLDFRRLPRPAHVRPLAAYDADRPRDPRRPPGCRSHAGAGARGDCCYRIALGRSGPGQRVSFRSGDFLGHVDCYRMADNSLAVLSSNERASGQ